MDKAAAKRRPVIVPDAGLTYCELNTKERVGRRYWREAIVGFPTLRPVSFPKGKMAVGIILGCQNGG
jgi:hypothetical protein